MTTPNDTKKPCKDGEQERIATIGGTFDALHDGHKEYINYAFQFADRVLIYVTADEFINGKKKYSVQPYQSRVEQIKKYLRDIDKLDHSEIRCIHKFTDLLGDFLGSDDLSAKIYMALVSPDYYDFFLQINRFRQRKGMKPFLILVKMRTRNANNSDISSQAIHHESLSVNFGDLSPKSVIEFLSYGEESKSSR